MSNNNKHTVSQKRLRDLAGRALQIVERHKDLVGLTAVARRVVPAASTYIKVYDEAVTYRATQSSEMEDGRQSLGELERLIRTGVAIVYAVMPSFDASELEGTVATPDRLISDARKLLTLLAQAGEVDAGDVSAALTQAVEKAETQWIAAREARMSTQAGQAQVREAALVLNRELVALRRILRASVGTSHIGYQLLRVSRVEGAEATEEEDTVVEDEQVDPLAKTAEAKPVTNGHNGVTHTNGVNAA